MKPQILLSLLFLFVITKGHTQNWNWAQNIGSTPQYNVQEIVKGHNGDVFICGRMNQQTTFGTITVTPPGNSLVAYIARMDTLGNYIWAKTFDVNYINFMDIEVNSSNELLLLAAVRNDVILDTVSIDYDHGENIVLLMNENGEILKKRNFGTRFLEGSSSNYNSPIGSITVDSQNNPVISFNYRDTAFFQSQILVANPSVSTFGLLKLDTDLNDQWVKSISFSGIWDLKMDGDDNIILVGEVVGPTAFDTIQIPQTCGIAGYVAKLDNQSGNAPTFIWTKLIQSTGPCASGQIVISSHFQRVETGPDNSIYVSGDFMNDVRFDTLVIHPSYNMTINSNMLVAKLNTNGEISWYKQAQNEISSFSSDLSVDLCGNVVISGGYKGAFDMGTGSFPWQNNGENYIMNLFVSSLDSAGTVNWVNTAVVSTVSPRVAMITPTRVWTGGHTEYIAPMFGSINPGGSADYSFFLAEISHPAANSCSVNSLPEMSNGNLFSIFPNPASTEWTILFKYPQDKTILKLVDVMGKEVKQWSFEGDQLIMQREALNTGLYFLQVLNAGSRLLGTQKIMIR